MNSVQHAEALQAKFPGQYQLAHAQAASKLREAGYDDIRPYNTLPSISWGAFGIKRKDGCIINVASIAFDVVEKPDGSIELKEQPLQPVV